MLLEGCMAGIFNCLIRHPLLNLITHSICYTGPPLIGWAQTLNVGYTDQTLIRRSFDDFFVVCQKKLLPATPWKSKHLYWIEYKLSLSLTKSPPDNEERGSWRHSFPNSWWSTENDCTVKFLMSSRQQNCWSLRCSWSIACWSCSNYIFILDLKPGFIGLGKDKCKTRRESFKFWGLVWLILEILW